MIKCTVYSGVGSLIAISSLLNVRSANAAELGWERLAFPLPESIWSVAALDANQDDAVDLIAMGETKVFALLAPDWRVETLIDTVEPKLLYCAALDADSDGDLDLALGRYRVPWIEFREAQKSGRAVPRPKGPDFSLAWIENENPPRANSSWPLHVIDREFNGIHGLATGDVNGDGKADLIADSISGPRWAKSLAWFQFAPDEAHRSRRHMISEGGADGRPHYLDFADMNGDGLGDLLLGDSGGGTFTWWQQLTTAELSWKKHLVAKEPGATNVKAGDMNGDGALDIIASCGHGVGVFWFEAPAWRKHVIDGEIRDAHALATADFDADQDLDVAVASFGEKRVRWYENVGGGRCIAHDIDTENDQQAYDLKIADLNEDGRPDLILAGRESRNVVWYRNIVRP